MFDVENVFRALKADYKSGKITINEVAESLFEKGYTRFIDVDYAFTVMSFDW